MLIDMLWLCIAPAGTKHAHPGYQALSPLTWETDATLFGWEKDHGSESSSGVRWHPGGSGATP